MIEFKIEPIERKGERVLTTAQLAEAYGTNVDTINRNFNRNKKHYIEGKHYYCLKDEELKNFVSDNLSGANLAKIRVIYLWTERGALLHAKSLNTKKAWEVYYSLVETYFRVSEISKFSNEDIYQKLEVLEQKLEMLEQKIDNNENNSDIRKDDIIKSIEKSITDNLYNVINTLTPAFECIYNKINKSTYILSSKNYKRKRKNK